MKRAACLLAAALLAFALAAPAFAAPETFDSRLMEESLPTLPPFTTAAATIAPATTQPETFTTVMLQAEADGPGYIYTEIAAFGTLGCSLLALLLAVIALSRTGKRPKGTSRAITRNSSDLRSARRFAAPCARFIYIQIRCVNLLCRSRSIPRPYIR